MPTTIVRISGCVSARCSEAGSIFVGRDLCLCGFGRLIAREDSMFANPLNALSVPVKQDAEARGCYVQAWLQLWLCSPAMRAARTLLWHLIIDAPRQARA